MESLGIFTNTNQKEKKPKTIAALWTFEGDCRHVVTEIQLRAPCAEKRFCADALWDTGASMSAISKELAYEMGLKPNGKIESGLADNRMIEAETSDLLFFLPDGTEAKTTVSILDMSNKKYDFIVGMDIILQGNFEIKKTSEGFDFYFRINKS